MIEDIKQCVDIMLTQINKIRILCEEYPHRWTDLDDYKEYINKLSSEWLLNEQSRLEMIKSSQVVFYLDDESYLHIGRSWGFVDAKECRNIRTFFKYRKFNINNHYVSQMIIDYLNNNPRFYKACIEDYKLNYYENQRIMKEHTF